jgi:hypothetical protein
MKKNSVITINPATKIIEVLPKADLQGHGRNSLLSTSISADDLPVLAARQTGILPSRINAYAIGDYSHE